MVLRMSHRSFLKTTQELKRVVREIDSYHLRIVLDVANASMMKPAPPLIEQIEEIKELFSPRPFIRHGFKDMGS